MRHLVLSLAAGTALSLGAVVAQAMPADHSAGRRVAPDVTYVSGGCGPGFHRTPWGGCRPNGGFYRQGHGYGRGCFVRATPYGPRRFCR